MEKAQQANIKINFQLDGKGQTRKQKDIFQIRWKWPSQQTERYFFNQIEKTKQANKKINSQSDGKDQASKKTDKISIRWKRPSKQREI